MTDLLSHAIDVLRPYQFRGKYRLLSPFAPANGTRHVRIFGSEMDLDLGDWSQRNIYLGSYEREETRVLRRVLRRGGTVVDVGANVGYFTALAARCVGESGRVIAFEPSPYAFERLTALLKRNALRSCVVENLGLSDWSGEVALYLDDSYRNHSPTMSRQGGQEYARVRVETLDAVLDRLRVECIDLMKIDVGGHEPRVLDGARRSIESGRVKTLLCEFNDHWLRCAGSSASELAQKVVQLGFVDPTTRDGQLDIPSDRITSRFLVWRGHIRSDF